MSEHLTRGHNRRYSARRSCRLRVSYRSGEEWRPATATDVSPLGCRLRIGEPLDRGTQVALRFDAPLADGSTAAELTAQASVTWSRLEGLSHHVGLAFVGPVPELQELMRALR